MNVPEERRKKLINLITALLVIVCLFNTVLQYDFFGDEKRVVKVAFFPMDGYHIHESYGNFGGMDVEYLKALCEYSGWEVEYVECESWEEALEFLSDQKVDLVGSAQYSAERAKIYQYADLASGYTFGVIATKGDRTIAYEDFSAMQNITFGMVENYVRENEFLEYLTDNGIENPRIIKYDTTAQMQAALDKGEIDAFVHTFTEVKEGQRLIGRFAPRPFYYISYNGNADVMRELNQAITDLKMNRPELEADLMNKFYYSRFDKAVLLTTEEKDYSEEGIVLNVGYVDGHYPFSYKKDGEFRGLSREMLEAGLSITRLELNYVELKDEQEARKALEDGKVDILAYCTNKSGDLAGHHLKCVREYANVPLVLVMNKRSNITDIKELAVVPYLQDKVKSEIGSQNVSVNNFDTQKECLLEVARGNVDAALCDGYLAEHLFRTDLKFENLQIKNVFSGEYPVYVSVREEDALLSGILSKTITDIDSRMINEYMLRENTYPLISIKGFIQDNSLFIILILLLIVVIVVFVARHLINDEKKIRKLMYKDTSIDIWNLNYLIYWGSQKLSSAQKKKYAVAYINLSQFRRYNTIYGWNSGEKLLKNIVEILNGLVDKKSEICARDKGDRFVLLLAFQEREEFLSRLKSIREQLEKSIFEYTGNRMMVREGVYVLPDNTDDLQVAISYADQALEFTDSTNEKSVMLYDNKLEDAIKERHEREKLLESVDLEKDFVVYYQPKVDIRTGEIVGAEALVRFLNPAEGGALKSPGFFVPYYEQTGKITEIDFFVYESACKMLRRRLDANEKVVPISCNFSRLHFINTDFAERFEKVINKYNISKELIEVEITETLILEELQQYTVMETLDILHDKSIRISIDDFGSGYSSLGVFESIPASVIKLDRSFLLNQRNYDRQVAIMRGIVNLAEELKAQIVCEGVETNDDIELMKEIGANVAQGYYYSKPVPESEFEKKLSE